MTNAKNRGNGRGLRFAREALASNTDECIVWPFYKMSKGYGHLGTHEGMCLAHRYVCIQAHGEPPLDKPQAAHSCGNTSCVNPRHLDWKDQSANEEDKRAHGTWLTRMGGAKLNDEKVLAIRKCYESGATKQELSIEFSTPESTIEKVVNRRSWRHI